MSERELKIGDIAHITGISEQDLRALIRAYDSLFTCRTIGSVRLFPEKAVATVREILELSEKGLAPEKIAEVVSTGKRSAAPEEPAKGIDRSGPLVLPAVVLDIPVIQDTLARQERRITRLAEELERERELRKEEVALLQEAVGRLQRDLARQQEQGAVIAEWVAYFDRQMDEVSRPAFERIRRAFER